MAELPIPSIGAYKERRKLGIFYTPVKVTEILCQWAIRNSTDVIFEPSFGGCGFLESSHQRLLALESKSPIKQLFGCDVDQNAFNKYLIPKYKDEDSLLVERFIEKDFLALKLEDFSVNGFSAVVGNPPFISYHKMSEDQRESVNNLVKSLKIKLDRRASLWAYFVLHSLSFLENGGRLALVLPGSFLLSNYSEVIRDKIVSCFDRSLVIQIGEKLFASEGTEESTSILLAEGFGQTANSSMNLKFASELSDVEQIISSWNGAGQKKNGLQTRAAYEFLSDSVLHNFSKVEEFTNVIKLEDVANISIGIVTGNNKFFIVNRDFALEKEIPEKFQKPIFSKFRMTDGLTFTTDDWERKAGEGFHCVFIDTRGFDDKKNLKLKEYLDSFPEDDKEKNITFSKRPVWHQPLYMHVPDAFFPYMHNSGPRIILNEAETLSTNTIHRISFKEINGEKLSEKEKKLLAISILSTYSQFSAELEGRVYGSGALKLEPSEVKRIKVIFPQGLDEVLINKKFDEINSFLQANHNKLKDSEINEQIREKVDKFILENLDCEKLKGIFESLSSEIKIIRKKRKSW